MLAVEVNGIRHEVEADEHTPLLYVLRNHLGLKGTRFGCGQGLCGACLVLIDGHPDYSCTLPLWSVAGRSVTTVEGLGTHDQPHPIASAFVAAQAAQCGYCTSGMLIGAAALVAENDDPTDDEIRTALDRNLCRCGAHNRIVRAVRSAAAEIRARKPAAG